MAPRQQIYDALFAILQTISGIKSFSKRWEHWAEADKSKQPALYLSLGPQNAAFTTGLPTKWTLNASIWLYASVDGDNLDAVPMELLNPIIDAITNILIPLTALPEQTLGGLVHRCRIEGNIESDEGLLGTQAVVLIPVTMYLHQ